MSCQMLFYGLNHTFSLIRGNVWVLKNDRLRATLLQDYKVTILNHTTRDCYLYFRQWSVWCVEHFACCIWPLLSFTHMSQSSTLVCNAIVRQQKVKQTFGKEVPSLSRLMEWVTVTGYFLLNEFLLKEWTEIKTALRHMGKLSWAFTCLLVLCRLH